MSGFFLLMRRTLEPIVLLRLMTINSELRREAMSVIDENNLRLECFFLMTCNAGMLIVVEHIKRGALRSVLPPLVCSVQKVSRTLQITEKDIAHWGIYFGNLAHLRKLALCQIVNRNVYINRMCEATGKERLSDEVLEMRSWLYVKLIQFINTFH